jgi:hypothetical protein
VGVGKASGAVAAAMSTLLGQTVFPLIWLLRGEGELKKVAAGEELWLVTMTDMGDTSLLTPFDDVEYCYQGLGFELCRKFRVKKINDLVKS